MSWPRNSSSSVLALSSAARVSGQVEPRNFSASGPSHTLQSGEDRPLPDEPADEVVVGDVLGPQQLGGDHLIGATVDCLPHPAGGALPSFSMSR